VLFCWPCCRGSWSGLGFGAPFLSISPGDKDRMSNKDPKKDIVPFAVMVAVMGFIITGVLYWGSEGLTRPDYSCPLWIGVALATALIIGFGYGVAKIWREPGRDELKISGLIYLSTLVIMTFGRILSH
jgi:Ni/Fe-hydrogenase subunit HybB-like protein